MKKLMICFAFACLLLILINPIRVEAAGSTYTVVRGDTLWKIAVKYEVGLSELIRANPQIENVDVIYPGMKINIPAESPEAAFEKEVIRLVNVERANNGLKPLKENWELSRVARYKSMDMRDQGYFSHTSPTYGSPFDMMKAFGIAYSYAGENIAMGQRTPEEVMKGWMNSPGHRRNILSQNFTEIGVGYAANNKGNTYWTQMFIQPR
ncbi:SafA/ExsA family spore coat assembly protein [Thermotalea metallivorans]|uniref:Chlorophenol reductase n=1 Tax=Thermotalea metallivorans TaxID=520762 RepID=A0A140L4K0_9FIRM|nr:SafA/ExsA family spore coat assembly protein [Thermotalea metallivorans]KXG75475.1 Chlorophenol reductase [Thermotalea metallivorans]